MIATTMTNTWAPLCGWESAYEISNAGEIRRTKRNRCKTGPLATTSFNGYRAVHLRDGERNKQALVHRLVLLTFVGSPPQGKNLVNHKNGIRNDNRLENLEWCDASENNFHAYRKLGRAKVCMKGELNSKAKLSDADVIEIRRIYAETNLSQAAIAKKFGVHQTMIGFIVRRESWTHI